MGRRALRKIDPTLNLSFHLRTMKSLPQPWSTAAVFARDAPLEVEVGCGKGLFLQTAPTQRPAHSFLGIEIAYKYARFSAARLAKYELPNAVVVHGDALHIFREFLAAESVHAIHVYFPDPWWKKRHHKRRVMNAQFLRDAERVLRQTGVLHFWTDVKDYYDQSLQLIAEHTSLWGPHDEACNSAACDLDVRTHFERRMRIRGEPVHRAAFTKSVS